jgi:BASS family bile acid:Na+ symporter
MTLAQLIPLVIQASILLLVFGLGLRATPDDTTYLFRHPPLLLRATLAMGVAVPIFAALLVASFDLYQPVEVALVLLSVSPVPPILPSKQLKLGAHRSYVYGLLVTAALFAIVLVPLMVELLGWFFHREAHISPAVIAKIVFVSVLIPLFAGLAVQRFAPAFAERIGPSVTRLGSVLLAVGVLPILISAGRGIISLIGNGTLLAITAVVVAGLLAGHLLGGPDPEDRRALAIASSMRHPGVALAIANANFPGDKLVLAAVLLFMLVNLIVTIPYAKWSKRQGAVAGGVPASS